MGQTDDISKMEQDNLENIKDSLLKVATNEFHQDFHYPVKLSLINSFQMNVSAQAWDITINGGFISASQKIASIFYQLNNLLSQITRAVLERKEDEISSVLDMFDARAKYLKLLVNAIKNNNLQVQGLDINIIDPLEFFIGPSIVRFAIAHEIGHLVSRERQSCKSLKQMSRRKATEVWKGLRQSKDYRIFFTNTKIITIEKDLLQNWENEFTADIIGLSLLVKSLPEGSKDHAMVLYIYVLSSIIFSLFYHVVDMAKMIPPAIPKAAQSFGLPILEHPPSIYRAEYLISFVKKWKLYKNVSEFHNWVLFGKIIWRLLIDKKAIREILDEERDGMLASHS